MNRTEILQEAIDTYGAKAQEEFKVNRLRERLERD